MATVTLSTPLDMSGDFVFFDTVVEFGPTAITATSAGGYESTIFGDFTFDLFGNVSGTLTGVQQSQNGNLQIEITGLNLDAAEASDVIDNGTRRDIIDFTFGGADRMFGSSGRDVLFSSSGRDVIRGNGGNDKLYGESGNDKLFGGAGKDRLWGGNNNDTIDGGGGRDKIWGGRGNDRIDGDRGNDVLSGNAGRDTFVFNANQSATDRITDFNAAQDSIELSGIRPRNVEVADDGTNTTITAGDATVILLNVVLSEGDITFDFA